MEGYEKLAHLMANHPETAMFQRFDFLNRLNLLYLQAELVELENELKACLKNDRESADEDRRRCSSDWYFLANTEESETWRTMLRTRSLLKEYSTLVSNFPKFKADKDVQKTKHCIYKCC